MDTAYAIITAFCGYLDSLGNLVGTVLGHPF
jgi:hypothetical protein